MGRLTISKGGKFGGFINPDGRERNYLPPDKIGVLLDRFTELEDKLESGQLVELPCKVGDSVFYLTRQGEVEVYLIDKIGCDGAGWYFTVNDEDHFEHYFDDKSEIGVEIFFTMVQAEARLKELQEKLCQ